MTEGPRLDQFLSDPLARSEARLRTAQAVARIGNWEIDLATRGVWASEEAFRIYGLPLNPEHMLPLGLVQTCPLPEHRDALDQALTALLTVGQPYDLRFRIRRVADGAVRIVHSMAQVLRAASGAPVVVAGTIQDITESEERTEALIAALRASEERARLAFDRAADAILNFDVAGLVTEANERAASLTGWSREELRGRDLRSFFSPAELEARPFQSGAVLAGETITLERSISRADGTEVLVEMSSRRLSDGLVQTILRDVTERHRLEEEIQLARRMESMGTLATGIAHDFNNLLVGILAHADLLRCDPPEIPVEHRESVEAIGQAARQAAELVRRLQVLSKRGHGAAMPVDLGLAVAQACAALKSEVEDGTALTNLVRPGVHFATGHAPDLVQALVNLGRNAVQAVHATGKSGGWVRFDVSPDTTPVGRSLRAAHGWVHLTVCDSGIGMPLEVRRRAFDPLYSTAPRDHRKGRGLGLSLVYDVIVRRHFGAVDLDGGAGSGTCVHLYLPRAEDVGPPDEAHAVPAPPGRPRPSREPTVLVVDDEPVVLRLARRILEQAHCRVITAEDGEAALAAHERHRSEIDLVVLDMSLPKLTGDLVWTRIRDLDPELPIVISTGDAGSIPEPCRAAVEVLPKPYTAEQLKQLVARLRPAGRS